MSIQDLSSIRELWTHVHNIFYEIVPEGSQSVSAATRRNSSSDGDEESSREMVKLGTPFTGMDPMLALQQCMSTLRPVPMNFPSLQDGVGSPSLFFWFF